MTRSLALCVAASACLAALLAVPLAAQVQPPDRTMGTGQQPNPAWRQHMAQMGARNPQPPQPPQSMPPNQPVMAPPGNASKASIQAANPASGELANPAPSLLQQPAHKAVVRIGDGGLYIKAENSNLSQILHDVSSTTGTKISGQSGEERIFGTYGPGNADEVMNALLYGSDYNVLMVGSNRAGAPREVVLTRRNNAPIQPGAAAPPTRSEEDSEGGTPYEDQDAPPQPAAYPQARTPVPPPQSNGAPNSYPDDSARTPQQLLEQLQQLHRQNDGTQVPPPPPAPQQ